MNGLRSALSITLLAAAAGGCASNHTGGPGGRLSAADFASDTPAEAPVIAGDSAQPSTDLSDASQANITGPIAASEGIVDVTASAGSPELPKGPRPDPVGGAILVDAKVGDVNGRPIYASKFLEPMAEHLRAKAVDFQRRKVVNREAKPPSPGIPGVPGYPPMPWRDAWRLEAREAINAALNNFIEDELLRAEAISSFAPEQKQNFFAFMQSVSDKMESQNMGSRSAADQALQGQGGLEAYLKAEEEKMLIQFQLSQKINRRVNIAWRDIKLAYDQLVALYGSEPAITIRRVEIKADNAGAAKEFQDDLDHNRAPFSKLAETPANLNNPGNGGLEKIMVTGAPETFTYYGNPDLNAAAQGLKSGQTVGPIKVGAYLDWLHRDEDRVVPALYNAQIGLENMLRNERVAVERAKYIERLKAKSTMTSVKDMSDRLLQIAEDRYLPKKAS